MLLTETAFEEVECEFGFRVDLLTLVLRGAKMSRVTRLFSFLSICLFASACSTESNGQDMLVLAFEDPIVVQGKKIDCDLYYVFLGDNKTLDQGDLLQIVRFANRPDQYELSRARFRFTKPLSVVQIDWEPQTGERVGSVEAGRILKDGSKATRYIYQVTEHSTDASQEGVKSRVRVVRFDSLPKYVKDACMPTMISRLSPEEQLQIHRLRAEQIETNYKIFEMYLDALK